MKDRILVRRITEPRKGLIYTPAEHWKYRASRTWADAHVGEIVAVGPGKVSQGYWRKSGGSWLADEDGIHHKVGGEWEWIKSERVPLDAKPGQMCVFGRFTDWESPEGDLAMIQEADIIGMITGPVRVGIDKFTHNDVGVERTPGSLEDLYSDAH
jgi:co-chaperonin GroES (HSP10)